MRLEGKGKSQARIPQPVRLGRGRRKPEESKLKRSDRLERVEEIPEIPPFYNKAVVYRAIWAEKLKKIRIGKSVFVFVFLTY